MSPGNPKRTVPGQSLSRELMGSSTSRAAPSIVAINLDNSCVAHTSNLNLRLLTYELGGRRVLRPTVLRLPCLMALHQQRFDGFPVLAGAQFLVCQAVLDVEGGVEIGMRAVATDHTAKRLLVGSVG